MDNNCLLLLAFLLGSCEAQLKCFQCSLYESNSLKCPTSSDNIKTWPSTQNYKDISGPSETTCVIGYDKHNKIYYQGGLVKSVCETKNYRDAQILKINGFPGEDGAVSCCTKSGCNWNVTTAQEDKSYDEVIKEEQEIPFLPAGTDWVPIAIIAGIILTLILCCCCLFCFRKKNKKEQEKRAPNSASQNSLFNIHNYDRASEKSTRGAKRIEVMEAQQAEPTNPKDRERYSAVDRKLYRRNDSKPRGFQLSEYRYMDDHSGSSGSSTAYSGNDPVTFYNKDRIGNISKTVFDNEEFREANQTTSTEEQRMPRKGKDWVHIWKSATDPNYVQKGDVNAFRYNSA